MTDHSPAPLPTFHTEPTGPSHVVLPAVTLSKEPGSKATIERPRRSAHWLAVSGRWMNRSFDPVEAEAIRESYGSVPVTSQDDGA
jgi:hypothetical protein